MLVLVPLFARVSSRAHPHLIKDRLIMDRGSHTLTSPLRLSGLFRRAVSGRSRLAALRAQPLCVANMDDEISTMPASASTASVR